MITRFLQEEDGASVVEIVLIIVVLVAMVVVFKEQITELVSAAWESINKDSKSIFS